MDEKRNLREELENCDGEFPTSWRPEIGDVLVGRLVRYDRATTQFRECNIAVIEDEDAGEVWSVWLLHAVLISEFKKQMPRPGERLGIKRLPDSHKGYKRYFLRVDRDNPDIPEFGDPQLDEAPGPEGREQ